MATNAKPARIDQYIQACPEAVQGILLRVRQLIRSAAPDSIETIRYGIPAFKSDRRAVYFAAWKKHISLYPIPQGPEAFREEIARYVGGNGTLRFPLDQPIPYDIIEKIVRLQMEES